VLGVLVLMVLRVLEVTAGVNAGRKSDSSAG
jgi:hypothetical protein